VCSSDLEIITLPANTAAYTNSSLTDGTEYTYRIRAYNNIPANSSYSNEATAKTPVNPPTNLTATAISSTQVNLSWTDNSQTEQSYKIERKVSGGEFAQIAELGANITAYSDAGLSPSTAYVYRVRGFNIVAGDSAYSNEASVTTLTPTGQPASSGGGGGGGCSIGARQNTPGAVANLAVMLLPLIFIAILRRKR
jgi:hypothetical protein